MKVLFFASVREALEVDSIEIVAGSAIGSTADLRAHLVERGGSRWAEVLSRPNLICAVNQRVVHGEAPLRDSDEVAFFPPVTGG